MINKLAIGISMLCMFVSSVNSQTVNTEDDNSYINIEEISEETYNNTPRIKSVSLDTIQTGKIEKVSEDNFRTKLKNGNYFVFNKEVLSCFYWFYLGQFDDMNVFFIDIEDDDNHYPVRMFSNLSGNFISALDTIPSMSPDKENLIWLSCPEDCYIEIEVWNKQCIKNETSYKKVIDGYALKSYYWADTRSLYLKCEVATPTEDENGNLQWPKDSYAYFSINLNSILEN